MNMTFSRRLGLAAALLGGIGVPVAAGGFGLAGAEAPPLAKPERPAGEGVLCVLVLTSVTAQIGRQCAPERNPALQAELERLTVRLDDYVLRNGPMTRDALGRFKERHGLVGVPSAAICADSDLTGMYEELADEGPDAMRREVDAMLSRPGVPTFGDCV